MKTKFVSLLAIAFFGISAHSFAQTTSTDKDTKWQQNHPRREEVNNRIHNQNDRINDAVKDGDMNKAEAQKLHKEDKQIKQEEKDMASQNGGHITKQEQKVLNKQENHVSRQIRRHK